MGVMAGMLMAWARVSSTRDSSVKTENRLLYVMSHSFDCVARYVTLRVYCRGCLDADQLIKVSVLTQIKDS